MKKILVIEDELAICDLLATMLRKKGYEVILAGNGKDGLARFRAERPDLTVLDLKMPPAMDGLTVLKKLHAADPKTPVVVLTGTDIEESEEQLLALGAAALIRKEVSLHRLGDTLKRLLHPHMI